MKTFISQIISILHKRCTLTSFARTSNVEPPMRDGVPTKHLSTTSLAKPTASKI